MPPRDQPAAQRLPRCRAAHLSHVVVLANHAIPDRTCPSERRRLPQLHARQLPQFLRHRQPLRRRQRAAEFLPRPAAYQCHARRPRQSRRLDLDAQPVAVECMPLPLAARRLLDDHAVAGDDQALPIPRAPLAIEKSAAQQPRSPAPSTQAPATPPRMRTRSPPARLTAASAPNTCQRTAPSQRVVPARDHAILEVGGKRRKGNARQGFDRAAGDAENPLRHRRRRCKAANVSTPRASRARDLCASSRRRAPRSGIGSGGRMQSVSGGAFGRGEAEVRKLLRREPRRGAEGDVGEQRRGQAFRRAWLRSSSARAIAGSMRLGDPSGELQRRARDRVRGEQRVVEATQAHADDQHDRQPQSARDVEHVEGGGERHQRSARPFDHDRVGLRARACATRQRSRRARWTTPASRRGEVRGDRRRERVRSHGPRRARRARRAAASAATSALVGAARLDAGGHRLHPGRAHAGADQRAQQRDRDPRLADAGVGAGDEEAAASSRRPLEAHDRMAFGGSSGARPSTRGRRPPRTSPAAAVAAHRVERPQHASASAAGP